MWPRLKNSPHTYAHEGLESIFLFEFIELQWVQTDFLRLSDNNNFESTKSLYRFSSILQNRSHIVARPSYQINPDRNQRFCSRGKRILHSWRNLGRNLSVYVAIRLQGLQGAGEHLLRNIGDKLAEGVEPEQLLPASPR